MSQLFILAQTYEEHMREGRFHELLGWILGGLAILLLIAGVFLEFRRKKNRK